MQAFPLSLTPPLSHKLLAVVLSLLFFTAAQAKLVTIRNDVSRVDTDGNVIDAHSGMILPVGGVFFLYGERYTNSTGFGPSPPQLFPKIVVYTSPDMEAWTYRGEVLDDWPTKPYGTFFTPWAVYDRATDTFVLWFNAYLKGCCEGNWGVATSKDGIHFTLATTSMAGKYAVVDCNALFVDDDGSAFMLYTSEAENHRLSIESLTSNYSAIIPGGNKGLLPDTYVEGAILFKRNSTYYYSEGSCCCFCRGGAGVVVYKSASLDGPWVRQPLDLNCDRTDAGDICGAFGERDHDPIRVKAQGIGLSLIPLADGTTAYLWHGERWISAPYNNPACDSECSSCTEDPRYIKGNSFSYWIPLAFNDTTGDVLPFADFVDSFVLDVAEGFGMEHLPGRVEPVVDASRPRVVDAAAVRAPQWSSATCVGGIDITSGGAVKQWGVITSSSGSSGLSANGTSLSLVYDQRAYIVESCENAAHFSPSLYTTRMPLLGKKLSFTVDLSSAGCGCNVALYAVSMPARDAQGNPTPSGSGDGYCDSNDVGGSWCPEMDIVEANTAAIAVTPHTCSAPSAAGQFTKCDKGGCSANSRKQAPPDAFGPGTDYTVDTTRPFRVATSWITGADGNLTSIVSTFSQGASSFSMAHTDALCGASYLAGMTRALADGMVPALSVWGDTSSGSDMTWLDSPPCPASQGCGGSGVSATFSMLSLEDV